jgi:hypothetical protein
MVDRDSQIQPFFKFSFDELIFLTDLGDSPEQLLAPSSWLVGAASNAPPKLCPALPSGLLENSNEIR